MTYRRKTHHIDKCRHNLPTLSDLNDAKLITPHIELNRIGELQHMGSGFEVERTLWDYT